MNKNTLGSRVFLLILVDALPQRTGPEAILIALLGDGASLDAIDVAFSRGRECCGADGEESNRVRNYGDGAHGCSSLMVCFVCVQHESFVSWRP